MPSLEQTFLPYDLSLLRAIAGQAALELDSSNARAAAAELSAALQHADTFDLFFARVTRLQPQTHSALALLVQSHGRFPAAAFTRKYGEVRPLGPAALSREEPWARPANATEALFYNGLVGRAFMESDTGPQEFVYIPTDLQPLLPKLEAPTAASPAQAVASVEPDSDSNQPASSHLVDDAVTVLAVIQLYPGQPLQAERLNPHLVFASPDFVAALLADLSLLAPDLKLNPERAKPFLQAGRAEQLGLLAQAWRDSRTWNDLLRVPGLRCEPGAWQNDPLQARSFVLKLCAGLPAGEWRSLESFIDFIRLHHSDFQRPAGDYDSWYIRDAASGEYLRGIEHWDRIDGALVRFMVSGPLHWLGLADLRQAPAAFRLSPHFPAFAAGDHWHIPEQPAKIVCTHDGTLRVSRQVNRFERFQAARIGEWLEPDKSRAPAARSARDTYAYRLTGNSLQHAAAQGITARQILAFLRRACEHTPNHIVETIERWGRAGVEARAKSATVLKLADPDLLERLMRSPKTRRWLGEAIGDRAVEVKDLEKLREAMLELGLALADEVGRP